ncbi:MAG: hypothetical protein ACFE0I_25770 [Elainellaceae cyanobacterium]
MNPTEGESPIHWLYYPPPPVNTFEQALQSFSGIGGTGALSTSLPSSSVEPRS